jgi:hypothetical protein
MKEALSSSETSVLTRATWRNIPEDAILHSNYRENLKSYMNPWGSIPSQSSAWKYIIIFSHHECIDPYIYLHFGVSIYGIINTRL